MNPRYVLAFYSCTLFVAVVFMALSGFMPTQGDMVHRYYFWFLVAGWQSNSHQVVI